MDLMLIVVYGVGLVSGLWTGLLISKLVRIESRLRSIEKRLTTMSTGHLLIGLITVT